MRVAQGSYGVVKVDNRTAFPVTIIVARHGGAVVLQIVIAQWAHLSYDLLPLAESISAPFYVQVRERWRAKAELLGSLLETGVIDVLVSERQGGV